MQEVQRQRHLARREMLFSVFDSTNLAAGPNRAGALAAADADGPAGASCPREIGRVESAFDQGEVNTSADSGFDSGSASSRSLPV